MSAYVFIGLVGMMVVNKAIYLHTHKLIDGTSVTHSHPYNKSGDDQPIKTHHHSLFEYVVLQNLGTLFFTVFFSHLLVVQSKNAFFERGQIALQAWTTNSLYAGRAPPMI